jgi:hypothetical protein
MTIRAVRLFVPGSRAASGWGGSSVSPVRGHIRARPPASLLFLRVWPWAQPAFRSLENTISFSFAKALPCVSWAHGSKGRRLSDRKARSTDDQWQPRNPTQPFDRPSSGARHPDQGGSSGRRGAQPRVATRSQPAWKRPAPVFECGRRRDWRRIDHVRFDLEPLGRRGTDLMRPP